MAHQTPLSLPLVLCEGIYQDSLSRKLSLLGVFNEIVADEFPTPLECYLYTATSDGAGDCSFAVRLVDDDSNEVLELAASKAHFDNPLATVEVVYHVETEIPTPGVYFIELLADGEVLASRRLVVHRAG